MSDSLLESSLSSSFFVSQGDGVKEGLDVQTAMGPFKALGYTFLIMAALVAIWRLMILSMEKKTPDMFRGCQYREMYEPDPKDDE